MLPEITILSQTRLRPIMIFPYISTYSFYNCGLTNIKIGSHELMEVNHHKEK